MDKRISTTLRAHTCMTRFMTAQIPDTLFPPLFLWPTFGSFLLDAGVEFVVIYIVTMSEAKRRKLIKSASYFADRAWETIVERTQISVDKIKAFVKKHRTPILIGAAVGKCRCNEMRSTGYADTGVWPFQVGPEVAKHAPRVLVFGMNRNSPHNHKFQSRQGHKVYLPINICTKGNPILPFATWSWHLLSEFEGKIRFTLAEKDVPWLCVCRSCRGRRTCDRRRSGRKRWQGRRWRWLASKQRGLTGSTVLHQNPWKIFTPFAPFSGGAGTRCFIAYCFEVGVCLQTVPPPPRRWICWTVTMICSFFIALTMVCCWRDFVQP